MGEPRHDDLRILAVALQDLARAVRQGHHGGLAGLPPTELEIMRYVDAHPGTSVGGVAEALALQPSNASAAVRGLVGRGLVERSTDPADRRVTRLRATPLAERNKDLVETGWAHRLAAALTRLDPGDVEAVQAAARPLGRLAEHARGPAGRAGPEGGAVREPLR